MRKLLAVLLFTAVFLAPSFAQTNSARMLSGVNAQTGTSYTIQASDVTKLLTFNNAGAVAVTLPAGAVSGFGAGTIFSVRNLGAGSVTVTCACTIFAANGTGAATLVLAQAQGADIYGDGANFSAQVLGSGSPSPLTTKGDLFAFSTVNARLPVGLNGQALLADSTQATGLSWGTGSSPIPVTNLLGQYDFSTGSGTSLIDISGNGNNGTFCGSAPTWTTNAQFLPVGLSFNGGGPNCLTLPSALNAARTIVLAIAMDPNGQNSYTSPFCGNGPTANDWGVFFANLPGGFSQSSPAMFSGANMYSIGAWGNVLRFNSIASPQGTQILAYTLGSAGDSTVDRLYVNNVLPPFNPLTPPIYGNGAYNSVSAGIQTAGTYQLGGCAAGQLLSGFSTAWSGAYYYLLAYSDFKQPSDIAKIFNGVQAALAQKGVALNHVNGGTGGSAGAPVGSTTNQLVTVGDSITFGTFSGPGNPFPAYMVLTPGTWRWADLGLPSVTASIQAADSYANVADGFFNPRAANNVATYWLGTNDIGSSGFTAAQAWGNFVGVVRQNRLHSAGVTNNKAVCVSMLSRTAIDAGKNAFNTLEREQWPTVCDANADVAADPCFGADGSFANAQCMQVDGIHPTQDGIANHAAPIIQRSINRLYGNRDWSSATTYAAAALAAVATTAGSEATNTITITTGATPANCQVGNEVDVQGVTPAGYNSITTGGVRIPWNILTRTATQITYYTNTTGLGAITVQGTIVCPQQQDPDVFQILNFAGNYTLEPGIGYTGQTLCFKNINAGSPVLVPFGAETINGAASFTMTAGSKVPVCFMEQLVSASAGGGNWVQSQ